MAAYDQGGGCPCGLYRTCEDGCEHSDKTKFLIERNISAIPSDQKSRFDFLNNMSLDQLKQASRWHQSSARNSILYSRGDKHAMKFENSVMNDAMYHFLASVALEVLLKAKEDN